MPPPSTTRSGSIIVATFATPRARRAVSCATIAAAAASPRAAAAKTVRADTAAASPPASSRRSAPSGVAAAAAPSRAYARPPAARSKGPVGVPPGRRPQARRRRAGRRSRPRRRACRGTAGRRSAARRRCRRRPARRRHGGRRAPRRASTRRAATAATRCRPRPDSRAAARAGRRGRARPSPRSAARARSARWRGRPRRACRRPPSRSAPGTESGGIQRVARGGAPPRAARPGAPARPLTSRRAVATMRPDRSATSRAPCPRRRRCPSTCPMSARKRSSRARGPGRRGRVVGRRRRSSTRPCSQQQLDDLVDGRLGQAGRARELGARDRAVARGSVSRISAELIRRRRPGEPAGARARMRRQRSFGQYFSYSPTQTSSHDAKSSAITVSAMLSLRMVCGVEQDRRHLPLAVVDLVRDALSASRRARPVPRGSRPSSPGP